MLPSLSPLSVIGSAQAAALYEPEDAAAPSEPAEAEAEEDGDAEAAEEGDDDGSEPPDVVLVAVAPQAVKASSPAATRLVIFTVLLMRTVPPLSG
ncbi:hypothetical protein [Paenarthrobacter sp. CAP02]|uniref:hypothetical protein n=1 Tax=Paenarthrobacter sp. CAP02 TaxID=3158144 RepID=UPI0032DB308F